MGRYTIPIQTVTPLFLAGADQFPELRAPSVRGALRYWLRAGLGGVLGDRKLDELRKAECEVFGSASGDMEGSASPIVIRVTSDQVSNHWPAWKPARKGRDYLYWSMSASGKAQNYRPPRCYFAPPYRWSLDLSVRPGAGAADQAVVQTLAALWLLVQLGGLGARSRRTAGSLAASEPQEELPASLSGLRFALQAATASELSTELSRGLGIVRCMFQQGRSEIQPGSPAAFDILHPAVCRIWVLSADRSGAP
jgi:CRISPR-associated protein Cmr1